MIFLTPRRRRVAAVFGLAAALAVAAAPIAEARAGRGGGGMGSRGSQTYSPAPSTNTAPGGGAAMQRSQTQPGPGMNNPGMQAPGQRGRFGGGFMGGLLGAGLIGALIGGGFFGGLGGIASFLGILLQAALIFGLIFLAFRFFRRRREEPAMAGGAPYERSAQENSGPTASGPMAGGFGGLFGGGGSAPAMEPITVQPADYEAFERDLTTIQTAYGREDVATLRQSMTPEMAGYLEDELRQNAEQGVVNRVTEVKLLQGDLAEAWREGPVEFATVAMRYSLKDEIFERATNRLVETGPSEATELWTFARENGGPWRLSALQQTT